MAHDYETRICGIPAIVKISYLGHHDVGHCLCSVPDFEYEICDRRGRPAPWLQRKMSQEEVSELESEIYKGLQ